MLRLFNRFHTPSTRYLSSFSSLIDIQPNILTALRSQQPVVALESTIITHGMPYPHNLETATEVEEIIRQENAIPATIAILNGRIKVGLSPEELVQLASSQQSVETVKVSRRDMAYVVGKQMNGGTTVAGTLIVAKMVGINVFATGGIGGVHRDGNVTMDVSADLVELGRNPVAVVASGVKSILDIPKTLEFLETQGVCVASYQSSDKDFPAFYTRRSGSTAPYNFAGPVEAAEVINSNLNLGLDSGILIAAPVPEERAMNENDIDVAIKDALKLAEINNVRGKEITPFLLSKISEITKGRSLDTNIALIKNNARIAAQIAVELAKLKTSTQPKSKCETKSNNVNDFVLSDNSNKVPVVIGASVIDLYYTIADDDLKFNGATYHSNLQTFGGGVGRNIAEAISKLYGRVHFISVVGNDQNGDYLKTLLPPDSRRSVVTSEVGSTASFTLILDRSGDCKLIVGNTEIIKFITPELIIKNEKLIQRAPVVIFDANLNLDCIGTILELCGKYDIPGFPKGVQLSQLGVIATASNMNEFVFKDSNKGTKETVILGLLPLFHVFGSMVLLCTMANQSGKLVLLPKFEESTFLQSFEKYRCTVAFLVPPLLVFLAKHPKVDQYDLSSLETIICGAAPISKELEQSVRDRLKRNLSIKQLYGMTELTSVVLTQKDIVKPGSVGDANENVYAKVIDENGNALGANQIGELCFKGTLVMMGYISDEQATNAIIDKEGWLHTGDIGYYDEDLQFFIVDRIKELIKWKGYQAAPAAFFEPTDMRKAHIPFELPYELFKQIKFISPNIHELNVIAKCLRYEDDYPDPSADNYLTDDKLFENLKRVTKFVNEKIENVIVTMGPIGILVARRGNAKDSIYDQNGRYVPVLRANRRQLHLYETKRIEDIVNVSGAGDSWTSGFVSGMVQGLPEDVCVSVGFEASKRALMSSSPVATEYFDRSNSCWLTGAAVKVF